MGTLLGYLQITRVCNHKCIYCSNPSNGKMNGMDGIKNAFDKLKETGYTDVMLTGGEPTLHPKFHEIVKMAVESGLNPRVITNGVKFADEDFARKAKEAGITIVHMSVYTYKEILNDDLRAIKGAYKQMLQAILNLKKYDIHTQVTTVISKYNQDHLYKTVLFLKKVNPDITHFVWNVLDPLMMLQNEQSLSSIPDLNTISPELIKTFQYLESIGNTFRIERVPLCKIPGYEWANTESRKLTKQHGRTTFFLDERVEVNQEFGGFRHDYLEGCEGCKIKEICGGIWFKDKYYKDVKVEPIKDISYLNSIKEKILGRE